MEKVKVGITTGDINGVGLEVILKTLANERIASMCTPIIYGSSKVVSYHKNIVGVEDFQFFGTNPGSRIKYDRINIINCWQESVNITLGKPSEIGGQYALKSLEQATQDLKQNKIDAMVTAPINKKMMQSDQFNFSGHTEYLTKIFDAKESLMLMVNEDLRVGLVTNHVPIRDVCEVITKEKISNKLRILNQTLKMDFGIERPAIAVLALNPHASDDGLIGDEEEKIIRPVIVESKKKGMLVMGPYPADGFFGSRQFRKFDAILAMYHDQGLTPFKALSFGSGVNFTAGISGVRTSPDHGTAFDIAGKNEADPTSFRKALFLSIDIARQRKAYKEMHANPVVKSAKKTEVEGEKEK
ncbi:MAG: 4-hydroxythreonine-4-phosphate dehydrogenase PdxA [Bacteroidota bacterium]